MSKTTTIPSKALSVLTARAAKLAEQVERATRSSPNREVRQGGTRIAEVLEEWLEEIQDLDAIGDESVHDRVRSFTLRLKLAEEKVKHWAGAEAPPARTAKKHKRAA